MLCGRSGSAASTRMMTLLGLPQAAAAAAPVGAVSQSVSQPASQSVSQPANSTQPSSVPAWEGSADLSSQHQPSQSQMISQSHTRCGRQDGPPLAIKLAITKALCPGRIENVAPNLLPLITGRRVTIQSTRPRKGTAAASTLEGGRIAGLAPDDNAGMDIRT